MPISVACSCGQKITAKNELAGKTVKCPKCNQPLKIPAAKSEATPVVKNPETASKSAPPKKWGADAAKSSHILDLLDEAGVREKRTGPVCPECRADMDPAAVICVNCGFHLGIGRRLETMGEYDGDEDSHLSESEKLVAKAEREIQKTPISAEGENFGDGPDSFIIAIAAIVGFVLLVGLSVGTIVFLEYSVGEAMDPVYVSAVVCSLMASAGWLWLTIVAFMEKSWMGVASFICALYSLFYGFQRFGALWTPTMMLLFGMVFGTIFNIVVASRGGS
jgi:hypothetical protein